jgi:GNAT superfamily N-acetyltransferase
MRRELGYPSTADEVGIRSSQLLGNPEHLSIVAADAGNRAVGWLHATVRRQPQSDAYVQVVGLVVTGAWRGAGLGVRLLAHAEEWAWRSGVCVVRVRGNVIRDRAHAFYLREGHTQAKTAHLFKKTLAS